MAPASTFRLGLPSRGAVAPGRRRQRGSNIIEFTLTITVILFMIFWIFEIIMVMWTYSVMADAAREGVRYAIVHGSHNAFCSGGPGGGCDPTANKVKTKVGEYTGLSFHDTSAMNVAVNYLDGNNHPGSRVQVTITYTYVPYISLPWTSPTLHITSEGRIMN